MSHSLRLRFPAVLKDSAASEAEEREDRVEVDAVVGT